MLLIKYLTGPTLPVAKNLNYLFRLLHPPATRECPQQNLAQLVQPFGWL